MKLRTQAEANLTQYKEGTYGHSDGTVSVHLQS